jgi:predicted lysophospholipase L1 biosynthesis ABC-type transport system permease subunit
MQLGLGIQGYDLAHGQILGAEDTALASGRALAASDSGTRNVVLDTRFRATFNIRLGETITVRFVTKFGLIGGDAGRPGPSTPTATLTVVGFFNQTEGLGPDNGQVLADTSVVDSLTQGQPNYWYALHLDPSVANAVLTRIQTEAPSGVHNYADEAAQAQSVVQQNVVLIEAVASLALFAAIFIIANAVALALFERRREIGILKAVGYTSRSVLAAILAENGIVGLTAGILAMAVAVPGSLLLAQRALEVTLAPSLAIVLGITLGSALACMLVAALVAWGAARVRPLDVLRYE